MNLLRRATVGSRVTHATHATTRVTSCASQTTKSPPQRLRRRNTRERQSRSHRRRSFVSCVVDDESTRVYRCLCISQPDDGTELRQNWTKKAHTSIPLFLHSQKVPLLLRPDGWHARNGARNPGPVPKPFPRCRWLYKAFLV